MTVVDAFLRAEGGQLEPGWLLLFIRFLLRRRGKQNPVEHEQTQCWVNILHSAYRNNCANIYLNLRLWCGQGLWEWEGNAGGFRSENGVLLLVCRGCCHLHPHVLVDNVASSCTKNNSSNFSKCQLLAFAYQCSPAEGTVNQCENHSQKSFTISTTRIAVFICLAGAVLCCIRGPTHFNKLRVGHRVPEVTSVLCSGRRRNRRCLTAL